MRKFLETLGSVKKRFFPASQTSAAQAGRPRSRLQRFEQLEQRTLLSITSEGLAALNIDLADSFDDVFGRFPEIRGSEIRVGVIADGYAANDELPTVTASSSGSGTQGTAMLEIIHDIAPQADLWFAPANSEADFESAVDYLSGQGVDVIVAAPWLRSQPWFEDGPAATAAASAAAANGIVFVSAAGDDGEAIHYQGAYSPVTGGSTDGKAGAHNFGDGSDLLVFDIPAGGAVNVDLQWSTAWGQSIDRDDLDLYLYKWNGSSTTLVAWSDDQQVSPGPLDDPVESLTYKNGPEGPVQLAIQVVFRWAEFVPGYDWPAVTLEIFATGDVAPATDAHGGSIAYTLQDRIFGPAAVPSVITVGAANYTSSDSVAPYSSHGPSTVLAGPDLTVRNSLDGIAIDNVSYSGGTATGTAAAAAHAGGIAALALQMNPNLSPAEIQSALTATAVDLGGEGYDHASGHGRFDALAALYEANPLALPDLTAESDRGYRNDDNITNTLQGPLEITGQVAPGAAVALYVDGQPFPDIQTTVDEDGNYSFTIDPQELSADILAQLEGFHAVSVEVTHSSLGDSPVRSPALHLTIDNTPPTIASVLPLASPDPLDLSSSNDIDVDVALSEAVVDSLGLSGLLPANLLLSGRAGGTVGTPESLEDNTWRFPITSLGEGALALSLQNIEDLAGNPLVADAWGYGIDLAIAATDADKLEGHDGETPFTFTVTRTGDLRDTTTVDWQFAHGTTDDADFGGTEPAGGTLTFAPGASTQTITVYVSGDTDFELDADETFTVSLANASTPAAIAPGLAQATGTIRNDDYNPEMPLEVSTLLDGNDQDYSPGNLSLREALALARLLPGPDVIMFDPLLIADPQIDPTITLGGTELVIDSDVNIQGLPGLTIDANHQSQVLRVDMGVTATITDLALSGGYSDYLGGAITTTGANLTLLGVTVTNSEAAYGGAVFAGWNGTVTLDGGSIVTNNTASVRGGAVYMYGEGSTLNVISATIIDNLAALAGGGVAVHNDACLSLFPGASISANTAGFDPNIHVGWKGLLSTELVVTNDIDLDDNDYSPGELSLREALRIAKWQPGPRIITFDPSIETITLAGSELAITSDVEIQGPGISGLTIDADNKSRLFRVDAGVTATIRDVTLTGGYADYLGGAITTSGANLTLSGVSITGSQAPYGGAIFAGWNGTVTLDCGTQLVGNEALVRGGAVYMYGEGSTVEILDAAITDNVAGSAGGGVAIHNDAVLALLPGSVVSQNHATSDANIHVGWKGLVSTELIVTTSDDVDDSDYTPGNLSLREALRIAKWQPGSDVITFAPDVSQITLAGSELAITSDVEIQGPGISGLTIDADNKSRLFRVDAGVTATIRDLTLTGGYADYLGGAITTSGARLTLSGVKITDSKAEYGGAIFAGWNGAVTLDGGTQLVGNEALVRGGAIYMYGEGAVVEVRDATITGNKAGSAGGAVAIHNAALLKWFVDAGGEIAGNETSTNKDPDIHIGWAGLVDQIYGA